MYLKKIIAHGFKSFADNTVIDLENNITGIVGPNGSGKSNVVDAIRWVLGEQSIKQLRADTSMADVIFSGSKSRNAMNSASVTLIFDNQDNYLNISYDEVSIKRRLYKDGTNEFFLNGEKCRLKDISDILIDSGVAKESFNIISQGKIDEILSNKPEDRRIIFEEAAGVLKYKKRKEEALKKLDKTHENMSRVNDIIKELEIQIEPLREQKMKALKYTDLNEELKDLEVSLLASEITNINYKYQENKDKIEKLNNEILSLSTLNSSNEAKSSSYKIKVLDIDEKIKNKQKELLDITTKVEKLNTNKQIIIEKKKYEIDNDKLHNNLIRLKEDELNLKSNKDNCINQINVNKNKLDGILTDINKLESDIISIKDKKSKMISKLNDVVRNLSIINSKIDTLKENIDNNSQLPYSVKCVIENPKFSGIYGTVGQIIEVSKEYSKALSVALSSSISNVITKDTQSAKEAINYLKNNNLGRVTFFPIDVIKPKTIDISTMEIVKKCKGFIEVLSKLVKFDKLYFNIIENQLGNVIVVDNIDNANIVSKKINYKYRVVTLDGEIIHVGGALTGGKLNTRNIITDKYELENSIKEKEKLENNQKDVENDINTLDYDFKALEDKLYLLNKEKVNIEENINNKNNLITDIDKQLEELNIQVNANNSKLNNTIDKEEEEILNNYYFAKEEKSKIESELDVLNNEKIRLSNELEEFEKLLKKDNSLYTEKNNLIHELEIEINRQDVKLDTLLQTLSETYQMTYENAIKYYKLDMDINVAKNKVNSLKKNIRDLGPVNILAPEEYDKVSERYEFLIHQQEDLSKAETTLLEIIDEMDMVMQQEFLKTFKLINENFQNTFKELFKGGNAEISLTDKNNILESGIEIVACPPGKTLKSINLLSGGEKTFTAISLLFAILKSRPVPFCVLDEVEAALDDVNVDAFGEYIKKLKNKTQFLIITHKKKTMEYADVLYGITMQESGVSKLVSVKLEELK